MSHEPTPAEDRPGATRRQLLRGAVAGAGAGLLLGGAGGQQAAAAPASPEAVVFFDDFTSPSTVDLAGTGQPGFNWYRHKWFKGPGALTQASNVNVANSVLTLGGGAAETDQDFAVLSTAFTLPSGQAPYYRGKVFSQGGLFEARIALDRPAVIPERKGPGFWSMAIEHVYDSIHPQDQQWPGQPTGYAHFIEVDFMEALLHTGDRYMGTIHDWHGTYVPPDNFWDYDISNDKTNEIPAALDGWHTFGCRWTPQVGTTPGRVQWSIDGFPGPAKVFYSGPVGAPPIPADFPDPQPDPRYAWEGDFDPVTPAEADRTYAVLDQQRLAVTLTTHWDWPIRVDWVRISDSTVSTGG